MSQILKVLFTLLSWIFSIVTIPIVLLIGLIRVLMGKPFASPVEERPIDESLVAPPVEERPTGESLEMRTRVEGDLATINANLDTFSQKEQRAFREVMLEKSDFALFKGRVKHGYDSRAVSTLERCPKCSTATQQMYGNFVYSTQKGMRVMWAPAGYFCGKCPTVIIDQDLVRGGVSRGFKFRGVLGLSDPKSDRFEPLDTWNGKDSMYIMDEDGGNVELANIDTMPEDGILYRPHHGPSGKKRENTRRRNKLAKQSRKKNRRRKK